MKNNRAFITIFLIVFIDLFGFGVILPLLPFIAEKYQATPLQIGLLTSVYSFFQLVASPILGRLSDRFGRKSILIVSQLGSMVGFLLMALTHSLPLLFLSRIIDGTTGGNISIAQAYIADVTNERNRARGMGILGAAFGLGFILGPAIGGMLSKISFSAPAYLAAFISLLSIVATALFLKETVVVGSWQPQKRSSLFHFKEILFSKPLGFLLVVFLLINLAFSGMQSTFALWTERTFAFGPSQIGGVFAFVGIMSVLTQLVLLPRLIKSVGERKLLSSGLLFMSIGLLSFPYILSPWMIFLSVPFLAIGNGFVNPTLQAIVSENVPRDRYGEVLGLLQSFGSFGRIFGPLLAGYLFGIYDKDVPFVTSGLLVMFTFILVLHYLPRTQSTFMRIKNRFTF